ncbi:MAG: NAD(P)-binding domain-containing protein, partial [Bacteroidales bacterium]
MKRVVFIGAGNLATNLAKEMQSIGYEIIQIYSKTETNARALAEGLSTRFTTSLKQIDPNADLYIFSVKDAFLKEVIAGVPANQGLWVHTAGSIPMDIFCGHTSRFGVFYPL